MRKIAVAVTGASGSIYAAQLLEKIIPITGPGKPITELGVIYSTNAAMVWQQEMGEKPLTHFENHAVHVWKPNNFYAPVASGSSQYDSLVVAPCSMGTLGKIANGISDNLITRAADVMLKERRRLILAIRETPYNLIHINNMKTITEAGGIICPASPAFYTNPVTIAAAAMTVTERIIQLLDLPISVYHWGEENEK